MHKPSSYSELTLVVMAAGIGSRYGGLKQLDPIGPYGEVIIDYSVYDALRAGFGKVVFVINPDMEEAFRARVGKTIESHCDAAYVLQRLEDVPAGFRVPPERQKPWGTAHAVLSCRGVVDSSFAVINADDFYGHTSFQILGNYLGSASDHDGIYHYSMVGYVLENTLTEYGPVSRGVCTVDADGYLVAVHERTRVERSGGIVRYLENDRHWAEIAPESIVSMNMWGFTPSLFPELWARFEAFLRANRDDLRKAEYFLPHVVRDLIHEGKARVRVLPTPERWFGMTFPQDRIAAKQAIADLIERGVYPKRLWGTANE